MNEIAHDQNSRSDHETESETEQQMRADFMRAEHFNLWCMEYGDPADEEAYRKYSSRWTNGEQRWAAEWDYLSGAVDRWTDDYAGAQSQLAFQRDAGWLSPIELRSEEQARYIANHGIERDDAGDFVSHYDTRIRDRAESPSVIPSPLASHQPGNAIAAQLANTERDGIER